MPGLKFLSLFKSLNKDKSVSAAALKSKGRRFQFILKILRNSAGIVKIK